MLSFEEKYLYKGVLKTTLLLFLCVLLGRITKGYFVIVLATLGLFWGVTQSVAKAVACFAIFPFLIVLDPEVLPKTEVSALVLRLAPLTIGLVLTLTATGRRGTNRLPFGSLFLYLVCAAISSINGWHAGISYMKLINFILFLLGIWLGTQNLQAKPREVYTLRCFFLGMIVLLVVGSLLAIAFPSISYSTNFMYSGGADDVGAALALRELRANGGVALFSGILNHSQALAPTLAAMVGYLLAEMIFIQKKATVLHVGLLVLSAVELFMTRSRTGLFSTAVAAFMVLVFAPRMIVVTPRVRQYMKRIIVAVIGLAFAVAIVGEMSSHMMSRWLFKSNEDGYAEGVGFKDAVTGTRQMLIEQSLDEFRQNPMFGMGFQVNYETAYLYGDKGFVMSAPVEKGLLATTILGEGGVVGSIAFIIFLICFYASCVKRRLVFTLCLFTVFMATNVGEATFFSPGGVGGLIWIMCVVGGFALDTMMFANHYQREIMGVRSIPVY